MKKEIDQYEKDWIGLNILDYDKYTWFKHDCNIRLNDLTNIIFGEKEEEIEEGKDGFSFIVPMTMAIVIGYAIRAVGSYTEDEGE